MNQQAFENPATSNALLEAAELSFAYAERPIFSGIDLRVDRREIVCLLGGSGCGKSTLLRVLAGLEAPVQGEISFLEQTLKKPHPRSALVFQQASLLPWLDVAGNVGFGLDFKHQPEIPATDRSQRISAAINAVGLAGKENLYPAQLSGGMAQRVALARALAREPELLFADEPFSALDAITRAEMQALLVEVVQRWHTAVLLVTHDIDEAILVADRIVLMGNGQETSYGNCSICHSWTVDIPHPRERHADAVTALRLEVLAALRQLTTNA